MLPRYLYTVLLQVLPVIILGRDPGEPKSVFQSSIQGEIKGIQVQFEVREVKVCLHGSTESIYFLCADITNQQDEAESMLLMYECQGQARTKEIKIGGKQQKLMLIDSYIPKDGINPESTYLFNLLRLEQNR